MENFEQWGTKELDKLLVRKTYSRDRYPVPHNAKLERLLRRDFNPRIGAFKVRMTRHEARNLRRHLFGSKGLKNMPPGAGTMEFELPNHWMLKLHYEKPDWRITEPSYVIAEFIPQEVADAGEAHRATVSA